MTHEEVQLKTAFYNDLFDVLVSEKYALLDPTYRTEIIALLAKMAAEALEHTDQVCPRSQD